MHFRKNWLSSMFELAPFFLTVHKVALRTSILHICKHDTFAKAFCNSGLTAKTGTTPKTMFLLLFEFDSLIFCFSVTTNFINSCFQMANRTAKDASTVKGTNPQFLVEKIIRHRIYDSQYWKEHCFALTGTSLLLIVNI